MGVREQGWSGAGRFGVRAMTGLLAAGLVAGVGGTHTAAADPSGPAAQQAAPVPARPMPVPTARTDAFEATRVMPLGDSITRGTGSPTRASYRMDLAGRLLKGGMEINYVGSQRDGTGSDINHEGHGGWSIDELSEELDGWLDEYRPDVVLLHAGTNNITQGDSATTTARKLSAMIDQIRTDRPDAYIFVAQIITSRVPREAAVDRAYNRLIPQLVADKQDDRITVVDQSSVAGIDLHDLHHPNDFGYSKMAWNWYQGMSRVFGTSGDTGPNPYRMSRAVRCLATKSTVDGEERHRTECRLWTLRTTTVTTNGEKRQVRAWMTLRETKQAYRVRVNGELRTRTRVVRRWTGPGNLLNI
ncbi:SGNH/GDSL hydrolase family protein [Couchioplanes caeruleus]|uniref:SGNH/GDSL hydrolase family protein n=1 Tax=Couchioplanes caeruleus TaxID=56438 RepID=UPI0020BD675F|nr:SGNH/GDSL hydrolase family protein [Couchioplanes caeruleus]UQU64814.1 SGNH/GDSL hydrolase family protein [Couchioplanes caeruleus]